MKLRNKKWLRIIAVTLAVALMMQMTPVGALSLGHHFGNLLTLTALMRICAVR